MQARCPNCTSVFETERSGLQFCPTCGQQVSIGEAASPSAGQALSPSGSTAAVLPPSSEGGVPWDQQKTPGAFFQTWLTGMTAPEKFWASARTDAPWTDAALYGWLVAVVSAVLGLPALFITELSPESIKEMEEALSKISPRLIDIAHQYAANESRFELISLLSNVVMYPLVLLFLSAIVHLFCLLLGSGKNGFGATVRAFAYGSSPLALVGLNWLGCPGVILSTVGSIYMGVQAVLGVRRMQQTSTVAAVTAVLLPSAVFCCTCCMVPAAMLGLAASAGGS